MAKQAFQLCTIMMYGDTKYYPTLTMCVHSHCVNYGYGYVCILIVVIIISYIFLGVLYLFIFFHSDAFTEWFIDCCRLQYMSIIVYYVSVQCTKNDLWRNKTLLKPRQSTTDVFSTVKTKHEIQNTPRDMASFLLLLFMEYIGLTAKIKRHDL